MVRYEESNLITNKKYTIFCHQVNCRKVMGAGIAKQIRNEYPEVYAEYKHIDNPILGSILPVFTSDGRICINMYAQDGFGRDKRYTDYTAFKSCLRAIVGLVADHHIHQDVLIAFPYMIGCGLAGGSWNVIESLIEEFSKMIPNDVIIVKLR